VAGCFYCIPVFDVEEIEEWIDGGQTALCPHCGIDSVLPVIDGQPDVVFVWATHRYWFAPTYITHSLKKTPPREV
jgi:hypothetical protein